MAARLTVLLPRLVALVVIWLLAAASLTFAAGGSGSEEAPAGGAEAAEKPAVLVVPDVRRQAYVFAKGILQDAGFSWRVEGSVKGYAANTVAVQNPAPGTRVVDNGAPRILLRLERNDAYKERGLPENASSFKGTPVVLYKDWQRANAAKQAAAETAPAETAPAETTPAETAPAETTPAETAPAETTPAEPAPPAPKEEYRKPDFAVAGVPREPADEMPLPRRARMVEERLDVRSRPKPRLVSFWLYQHSWIVTGARFGWKDGDTALEILIKVDRRLQNRFGFGGKSERVARQALAEVRRKKG